MWSSRPCGEILYHSALKECKMEKNLHRLFTKLFATTLVMLLTLSSLLAQQSVSVSGIVTDEGGSPIIGATVMVKGDNRTGTVTDWEGKFTLFVPNESTVLAFSYIGMQPQEAAVGTRTMIEVKLASDSQELEEVIVVGYGQQKKASSVGSIATTKGDDLLKTGGVSNVSEALQGQMAGVVAVSSSSKPGEDTAEIFIRGKSSTSDNTPLYLVDGVERDINDIDMNEVESVSVLKDASATAVYGVKGANGVILVTTKRGAVSKAKVNFSMNVGFKQPTTDFDFGDYVTAMNLYNEAQINDNNWGSLIAESTISAWEQAYATGNYGPYNAYFPEVDWIDEATKNFGIQHNYNVNVSGGTERMKYFASLAYLFDGDIYDTQKQEDYDPRFYYKRFNWRTNFDYSITESTTVSVNIAGLQGIENQPGYRDDSGSDSYMFNQFYTGATNMFPIMYSDGAYGSDSLGDGNIIADLNETGQRQFRTFKGMYDLSLKQELDFITKGLSVSGKLSYTSTSKNQSKIIMGSYLNSQNDASGPGNAYLRYYRTYDYSSPIYAEDGSVSYPILNEQRLPTDYSLYGDTPGGVSYNSYESATRQLYYEFQINYVRTFADEHDFSALALVNRRINRSGVDFPSYEEDWVGRVTYGYKEKYLTEINASYTGSEKFAPGRRFGFFPSFSVGWRPTEEPWMANIRDKWLSNMKIRYSWGKVGSDNGADRFNYIQTYSTESNVQFGEYTTTTYNPLYLEGTLANEAATWETAVKQNLGVEMTILRKLNLTVDLFKEDRDGILTTINNAAPWIGISLPSDNIGITKNHGVEAEAKWRDKIGKHFNYNISFSFGTSENRIVYADDPLDSDWYLKDEGKSIDYQSKYLTTGNFSSLNDIFNSPASGISGVDGASLTPGDLMYVDYNLDGQITSSDMVPSEYNNYPTTTYSSTIGFSYKNFGFSAMLYAATGVYKADITALLYDFSGSNIKVQTSAMDRWTYADAASTDIIRPTLHITNTWNQLASNYNYTDHSYLRLKNVEVNYVLPAAWTKKVFISRCQIYANGTNLWTIQRNDSRRDPETSSQSVYPIVKRYNIGLRVTFD